MPPLGRRVGREYEVLIAGDQPHRDDDGKNEQEYADQHPCDPDRALHAQQVDARAGEHRRRRDRPLLVRPRVGTDRERSRTARGDLAGDERVAGERTPPPPEPLPAVDVGPAGARVHGGQLGG